MASKRYKIVDPSTIEELNELIYRSLITRSTPPKDTDHTFTIKAERIFDEVATKRGDQETREFVCRVFNHHPLPRVDYYVVATIPGTKEAIRIELRKGMLEATVILNE